MKLYVPLFYLKAKTDITVFHADEEIVQRYLNGDFSDLLNAVKYAEKHERQFNPFPMLKRAFSEYKPPANAEELLLKAEIEGDAEWADFWRKYATA